MLDEALRVLSDREAGCDTTRVSVCGVAAAVFSPTRGRWPQKPDGVRRIMTRSALRTTPRHLAFCLR
jgi:hypothetical protein